LTNLPAAMEAAGSAGSLECVVIEIVKETYPAANQSAIP